MQKSGQNDHQLVPYLEVAPPPHESKKKSVCLMYAGFRNVREFQGLSNRAYCAHRDSSCVTYLHEAQIGSRCPPWAKSGPRRAPE